MIFLSDAARLQKGNPDADAPAASASEDDAILKEGTDLFGSDIGWPGDWYTDWPERGYLGFWCWIWYLLKSRFGGWRITILAVSLGGPFWFDTLSKFMNVRNSGKPPEQSSDTASA